ncbi:MAG: hypothetical protein RBU23_02260 [Candidatus Auribacterota bacterium]|jgi:hypothetical protein|nr:hypothetical protein [Candidatus Auribacterota bacterium]
MRAKDFAGVLLLAAMLMNVSLASAQDNKMKDKAQSADKPVAEVQKNVQPVEKVLTKSSEVEVDPVKKFFEDATAWVPEKPQWKYLKWGFEERIRQEYWKNWVTLSKQTSDNWNYFRFRTQLWFQTDPAEWLSVYLRLTSECRAFMTGGPAVSEDMDEIFFDNLYFDLKRPLDLPISVRFGRQDMFYGKGFIIMDGTPSDGSRSHYVDAVKATLHIDDLKTNIDALVIETNRTDRKFFRFNPTRTRTLVENEIQSYGYYITSKYFENMTLEQYYLYTDIHGQREQTNRRTEYKKLNTFGGRFAGTFWKNFQLDTELAYQFGQVGRNDDEPVSAMGTYVIGTYNFPVEYKPALAVNYYYLSGDDPKTRTREDWDPLFSRWPLWGDLLIFPFINETGIARHSNTHKLGVSGALSPLSWTRVTLSYDHLWADENTFFGTSSLFSTGRNRGDLFMAVAKFTLTKNVSCFGQVEQFYPGSYYRSEADPVFFLRWELKITY